MRATRKRKQSHPKSSAKPPETTVTAAASGGSPFPGHPRPTSEECVSVRDVLLSLHGFPQEFIKYRNQRLKAKPLIKDSDKLETLLQDGEADERESVLDGVVKTILSQNTTELNSGRAFVSLKSAFPTRQDVVAAESKCIEDAIRCGGLAPTKSSCIKNLLCHLLETKGKLCMEYLRELSINEVKAELSLFKGIGPKTVFQIAKAMGWVPSAAGVKSSYLHLNQRIPCHLKFDLNCLLYTHGKICRKCSNRKLSKKNKETADADCPLLAYSRQSTVEEKFENVK